MNSTGKSETALLGGAVTTIIVWVIDIFVSTPIPSGVVAAITTVVCWVCAYLAPPDVAPISAPVKKLVNNINGNGKP